MFLPANRRSSSAKYFSCIDLVMCRRTAEMKSFRFLALAGFTGETVKLLQIEEDDDNLRQSGELSGRLGEAAAAVAAGGDCDNLASESLISPSRRLARAIGDSGCKGDREAAAEKERLASFDSSLGDLRAVPAEAAVVTETGELSADRTKGLDGILFGRFAVPSLALVISAECECGDEQVKEELISTRCRHERLNASYSGLTGPASEAAAAAAAQLDGDLKGEDGTVKEEDVEAVKSITKGIFKKENNKTKQNKKGPQQKIRQKTFHQIAKPPQLDKFDSRVAGLSVCLSAPKHNPAPLI